jgi:hypothetical protein
VSIPTTPGATYYIAVMRSGIGAGGSFQMVVSSQTAASEAFGAGCPPGLTLDCTPPLLGQPVTIGVTGGAPSTLGALLLGTFTVAPYVQLPDGCEIYLDPPTVELVLFFVTDVNGAWTASEVVSSDPALECLQVNLQVVLTPTASSTWASTNGLRLVVGH